MVLRPSRVWLVHDSVGERRSLDAHAHARHDVRRPPAANICGNRRMAGRIQHRAQASSREERRHHRQCIHATDGELGQQASHGKYVRRRIVKKAKERRTDRPLFGVEGTFGASQYRCASTG